MGGEEEMKIEHLGEENDDIVNDNKDLPEGYWHQTNVDDSIDSSDETIESSTLDPVKTYEEGIAGLRLELQNFGK